MLTEKALEGFKKFIERNIAYARYKIGGTYHRATIHRKERLTDGKVAVYFSIIPQAANDVIISEVQLFDTNNDLWASKAENIEIKSVQEGVLYRFAFDIKEV
ncbi:hypothetical protein [Tepidibacter formicigenes]|jgi:hypothetical protein|uniref:Uncharacterized protein n=1 Tax=Tepidibacter formicigenes DSM 15518 TaxID=1123349 RepID=A0A1M6Q1N3_9FIRM|nr:hypothetical protein [Tepidibacter formicigenes]SHK14083.1 hypothetical protein SAMN02744037_01716 [Tepidibacter formicigenes DSM 15518]